MATEIEQLKKDLEMCDERHMEVRAKLSRADLNMTEYNLTAKLLEDLFDEERELLRLIKEKENWIKYNELTAEATQLVAKRAKLELNLKDTSGDEKEVGNKKVAELSAAIIKTLAEAAEFGRAYEENYYCGDDECGCCYSYDHLAGANGYNSY